MGGFAKIFDFPPALFPICIFRCGIASDEEENLAGHKQIQVFCTEERPLRWCQNHQIGTFLFCVMLCSGFPAQTVVRSTDAVRAFTFPWGTEGDKVEVTAAQGCGSGRNQAFFVLMAGTATRSRAQRRSSGQQCKEGLTAFPLWVGRELRRPGGPIQQYSALPRGLEVFSKNAL